MRNSFGLATGTIIASTALFWFAMHYISGFSTDCSKTEPYDQASENNAMESDVWSPCAKNHPGLCKQGSPELGYYDMKFPTNALDEGAISLVTSTEGKTFFHFGSGSHHAVGMANMELEAAKRNFVISTTASYGEAEDYLRLITPERPLNEHYTLLYGNAFLIKKQLLPKLDFAMHFHLGEYGKSQKEEIDLLSTLVGALRQDGKLVVNKKSRAFTTGGRAILQDVTTSALEQDGKNILPIPLLPTKSSHTDLLFFSIPMKSCRDDVVYDAFHHPQWGYIYQTYCREYDTCTAWYLPEQNLYIDGVSDLDSASKLVIVSHPDDELIFGGNDIGSGNQSDVYLVFATRDFQRDEMAKEVIQQLGLAGGMMFTHGDTNILETRADYRLYIDLKKIIKKKSWDLIITHEQAGEYGHPFHKILHRMVMNILVEISMEDSELLPKELKVFGLNCQNIDEGIMRRRVDLLERVYKRPSSFWKQIFDAGTRVISLPTSFYELNNDTICRP